MPPEGDQKPPDRYPDSAKQEASLPLLSEDLLEIIPGAVWQFDLDKHQLFVFGREKQLLYPFLKAAMDFAQEGELPECLICAHPDEKVPFVPNNLLAKTLSYLAFHEASQSHTLFHSEILGRRMQFKVEYSRNPGKEPDILRGYMEDIENSRRRERLLEHAVQEAERANHAKSEFLARMSHEIRTPLSALMGSAEVLMWTVKEEKNARMLEIINQSGNRLLKLINEVLDLSKIEAGRIQLDRETFSPRACVEETVEMFRSLAESKSVEIDLRFHPSLPRRITADIERWRQIQSNIIGNALKFTQNGTVQITVSAREDKSLHQEQRMFDIIMRVRDTGIGIEEEKLREIFVPFSQASHSTSREFGGTGLGLAIAKRLALLMGGDIVAESEPDKGSLFTVTISAPGEPQEEDSHEPSRPNRKKVDPQFARQFPLSIAVADDNAANRVVVRGMLEMLGYPSDEATHGKELLDLLKENTYDLLLVDLKMPEMDGLAATREIRKQALQAKDYPHPVRIVAVTADAMLGDRDRCLAAGMDEYLAKPIKIQELMRTLEAEHAVLAATVK